MHVYCILQHVLWALIQKWHFLVDFTFLISVLNTKCFILCSGSRQSSSLSKRQGASRGRADNSEGTSSGKSTTQSSRGRTTETEALSSSSAMASEEGEGARTGGSEETPNPTAGKTHFISVPVSNPCKT